MAEPSIPKGSLVLVTGANGFIATHIANAILGAGFKVRGTVRSLERGRWAKEYFDKTYGPDAFELAVVADLGDAKQLSNALQDCSGVIHAASDVSMNPDPKEVIAPMLANINTLLTTCASTPTIKRVVLTSSSTAMTLPRPNEAFHLDSQSWLPNASSIAQSAAGEVDPYSIYGASKALGEQRAWEFMADQRPNFVLNAVLPESVFGGPLEPGQTLNSTAMMAKGTFDGDDEWVKGLMSLPPQWFVDVRDVARLHLAGLVEEDVQGERLPGFGETFNFNTVLGILRKLAGPEAAARLPKDRDGLGEDISTVDTERSQELLRRMGRTGFKGLEQSLRECCLEVGEDG